MIAAPTVRFFNGRSECFVQDGSRWRRLTLEEEARDCTGYARETAEPHVGVYVVRRQNGLVRLGLDLWKLSVNLRPAVIEHLERRWRQEAAAFSKSLFRTVGRRVHFSKSFARFEIAPERLEAWKLELESVLSDPDTYESI
jgi:hypothetical protein